MSALTHRCYACGVEYVPLVVEDGRCPDCGSPATPLVGEPTVLDVRPVAALDDAALPEADAIEVIARDDTDRLIAFTFALPRAGRPYAIAIAFDDVTVRRGDEHWAAVDGPDRVASAVAAYLGGLPDVPPDATAG